LYSPDGATCLAQPTPYRLKIANFSNYPFIKRLRLGWPLRIYGKALRFPKLKSYRQPTVKIWWS